MAGVLPILNGLRRIIAHHVSGNIPLISPVSPGDTIIEVLTTIRLRAGDEILLTNGEDVDDDLYVESVIDETHIELDKPARFAWETNDGMIKRAFSGNYVKAIYLGEPDVIPMYPAITVNINTSHSEFWTTRATKERYQIEIGIFVEDANQESGATLLWDLTDRIQAGLKKNVYPLVSDYQTFNITANIADGDLFVKVVNTALFTQGCLVLIEDSFKTQEFIVDNICDSTTLKLQSPVNGIFYENDTQIIVPQRFIFNSWPADITFGKILKGTLLKGAAISWFAEEMEIQFNNPWTETQLK